MNVSVVSPLAKRHEDFDALQSALQSGNISGAQTAFAGLLQEVQKTTLTSESGSLFANGTQASKDLNALGSALKSGNLSDAQKAFATLQQDIQAAGSVLPNQQFARGHHPYTSSEVANGGAQTFKTGGPGTQAAQAVGSILNLQA